MPTESAKPPSDNQAELKTGLPQEILDTSIPPRYRYLDLSHTGREVLIEYEGQIYRLRTTRNGKLILNK